MNRNDITWPRASQEFPTSNAASPGLRAFATVSNALQLALLLVLTGGTGCKSVNQYASPQIEGRVVDAHSRQPIKDVVVRRVNANQQLKVQDPPKGAQLMAQVYGVHTGSGGDFRLDCVRALAFFRHASWYSVTLSFEHPAYTRILATYTLADATNTAAGKPTVATGDVLLVPINGTEPNNR